MIDLQRSDVPFRLVSYAGNVMTLGRLEAAYFDLLWRNRGLVIDNDWAYSLLWPGAERLVLRESKRLDMVVKELRKKLPGVILTKHGFGRYIPAGSGLTIQRMGDARRVYVYVRPALPGTPVEAPRLFNE